MHGNIDIANFADDNTHCTSANYRDNVVESLKQASVSLFIWFKLNLLKSNSHKFHFFRSTDQEVSLNVDNFTLKNINYEKHIGVKIDSKLTFDQHFSDFNAS